MSGDTSEGGLGGKSMEGTRDIRLVERALRERWPIPQTLRGPLIERLSDIVTDPEASLREATAAARAILSASKINVDLINAAIRADEHENLSKRLEVLERDTRRETP